MRRCASGAIISAETQHPQREAAKGKKSRHVFGFREGKGREGRTGLSAGTALDLAYGGEVKKLWLPRKEQEKSDGSEPGQQGRKRKTKKGKKRQS